MKIYSQFWRDFCDQRQIKGQNTKQSRFCCHIIRGHVTDRHVISNNENTRTPASGVETRRNLLTFVDKRTLKEVVPFSKLKEYLKVNAPHVRHYVTEASGTDNNNNNTHTFYYRKELHF